MRTGKKVAIGVGGSFHSERMALALTQGGYHVDLYPTLPRFKFQKFNQSLIHPIIFPEIVLRAGEKLGFENSADLWKMRLFGWEFAKRLRGKNPDVVISWSSFGVEAFRENPNARKILIRDSAHIQTQFEILRKEFARNGLTFPIRAVCEERELQEYEIADEIIVLSQFAYDSFRHHGVAASKLSINPIAADTEVFFQGPERKLTLPLKVVYFGNISLQKGITYLLKAMEALPPSLINLELVGTPTQDFLKVGKFNPNVKFLPYKAHAELSAYLRDKDVFIFPSLHDGFGAVVPQAMATGLIPVVTDRCGAADLITPGKNGLIIPAGDSDAIVANLTQLAIDLPFAQRLRDHVRHNPAKWTWENYSDRLNEIMTGSATKLSLSR